MKIYILVGHPDTESMCRDLAHSYAESARKAGHEVRETNLGDLHFDPILHKGYKVIQALEPDLVKVQEDIKWCEHFVIIYPTWWSTMPALLKGMFDRMWLPKFAFQFTHRGMWWSGLLKGRTATVFVSSDTRPIFARFLFGDNVNEIRDGILGFAGIRAKIKKIGPMKALTAEHRAQWNKKFAEYGRRAY